MAKHTPEWVESVIKVAAQAAQPQGVMGPLGWRWAAPMDGSEPWVICVYPTPGELYAGPYDGKKVSPGYRWNMNPIFKAFDKTPLVIWTTPCKREDRYSGAEVDVCGSINDKPVWLRLFNTPPSDEPATVVIDPSRGAAWAPGDRKQPKTNKQKRKKTKRNDFEDDDQE